MFDPARHLSGVSFASVLVIINPPYEIGRSRRPTLRSPDLLRRFGAEWPTYAEAALVGFPADGADLLADETGHEAQLATTVPTTGATLGVFDMFASHRVTR